MIRFRLALLALLLLTACGSGQRLAPGSPIYLADFRESQVSVTITLEEDASGQVYLAALFTPEQGGHLYSKDIPATGVEGIGRPTLLELTSGSQLTATGELSESVASVPLDGSPGLLVYPAGPVTLRLAVELPEGEGWFDEQISLTYMACADGSCFPPVVEKLVPVRVPGSAEVDG